MLSQDNWFDDAPDVGAPVNILATLYALYFIERSDSNKRPYIVDSNCLDFRPGYMPSS